MNKKMLLVVAAATMMTSVASASPLVDYTAGKVAVDLTWRNSEVSAENKITSASSDKKNNMDWGITAGVGNNWAIQYRQFNPKADFKIVESGTTLTGNAKLNTQEFNVLYKVDQNVSIYTGIMKTKGEANVNGLGSGSTKESSNLQLGLIGSTKLAEKTTAYASVGTGKDLMSWEIGVGQEIAPNVQFNVNYREVKANKLEIDSTNNLDGKAKGLGLGITYNF